MSAGTSIAFALTAPAWAATTVVDIPMDLAVVNPVIEVSLNGRGPYRLIMDSGAGAPLILDADLAGELALKTDGTQKLGDPSNPHAIEAGIITLKTVEVGALRLEDVSALTWDQKLYTGPDRPRGVVGLGLFGNRIVTFDFPKQRFRVAEGSLPPPDGATILPARWEHIPSIEIEVGGRKFDAHIDTGSMGYISVPDSAKEQLPLESSPVEVGRARSVASEFVVTEAPLKGTARIGSLTIENPPIRFMAFPKANIGSELLRSLAVTFDRSNGRVRLDAEGPIAPPKKVRLGLKMRALGGDTLPVDGVEPGSIAEKAGVHVGDSIVRINGKLVGELGPGDISAAFRSSAFTLTVVRDGREIEIPVSRQETTPS
jgi:predicted aspartyl protease